MSEKATIETPGLKKKAKFAEAFGEPTEQLTPKKSLKTSSFTKEYIVDDLEKPWNYQIMRQLKKIGEKSFGYKWMHNEEIIYYTDVLKYLTMAEIILTVIHGANIFGSIVTIFSTTNKPLIAAFTTAQAILFIIITILKTWKESAEYVNRIDSHRTAFIKFGQISTKIQNQFCIAVGKRDNDSNFLDYTTEGFASVVSSAPNIRVATLRRLLESTRDSNVSKPLSLESIAEIDIVVDKAEESTPKEESQPKIKTEHKTNHDVAKFLNQGGNL